MADPAYESWLQLARPFLKGSYDSIDPSLPRFFSILREQGASECWHRHSTFFEHLVGVYRILKLWKAPDSVARCGLFHSVYSNSYVNLAIFQPDVDRQKVRDIIGDEAEELVHMFCIVPRQQLIYDMLLFQFTDEELLSALNGHTDVSASSENVGKEHHDLHNLMDTGIQNEFDGFRALACRHKVKEIIPPEGITVKHIRTGEDVQVPRRLIAIFLFLTMADISDQFFNWMDSLFDNHSGTLCWEGNNWTALWPGIDKPGLWMSALSRMGVLLNLIVREEQEMEEKATRHGQLSGKRAFSDVKLVIPPVFNDCTAILNPEDQIKARDLYWKAVCYMDEKEKALQLAEPLLLAACKLNVWVGEPHVLLAQIFLSQDKYDLAEREAKEGLRIILEWGSNWDKRMAWEAWIAWSRILLNKAKEKSWPKTSWGILNLGLVT